jgi:hypothetical protein
VDAGSPLAANGSPSRKSSPASQLAFAVARGSQDFEAALRFPKEPTAAL